MDDNSQKQMRRRFRIFYQSLKDLEQLLKEDAKNADLLYNLGQGCVPPSGRDRSKKPKHHL